MLTKIIKLLIISLISSVAFIGCSSLNNPHPWNPDKAYPELTMEELESCPKGVGDDPPRWVCNPELAKSNRLPHVAVGLAHYPEASDAFNRRAAAADGRTQIASTLATSVAGNFSKKEHGESGNRKTVDKSMTMIKNVVIKESTVLGYHYGDDGRVFALVGIDSRTLKPYKPNPKVQRGFEKDVFAEDKDFAELQ